LYGTLEEKLTEKFFSFQDIGRSLGSDPDSAPKLSEKPDPDPEQKVSDPLYSLMSNSHYVVSLGNTTSH
jgi:hypothetical protein